MKAALLVANNEPLVVDEVADPELMDDGAIVRIEACGVCRTDWHLWKGHWDWIGVNARFPLILGHEMAGTIEAVGPEVKSFAPGDRVLAPFHYSCGFCDRCQSGLQNLCRNPMFPGSNVDGGFGELVAVPHADVNLLKLPDSVSSEAASALGCRFMTAFHAVVELGEIRPGETIAIFGCGGVGLSAVMVAAAAGATVIAVDIDERKLQKAESVGAQYLVNSQQVDAVQAIQDLTSGGVNVAVDALGIRETVLGGLGSLAVRGRHIQVGLTTVDERGEVAIPTDIMVAKELRMIGCHGMPRPRYAELVSMVGRGTLTPDALVGERASIGEATKVLEQMTNFENLGFSVITSW
jgi:D-arabinose 1-dehydrogenase-like Zn-dependent alcohol dehydrogenase